MGALIVLVPVSLAMGAIGLAVFLWSLRTEQYQDLEGDAERILLADDRPIAPRASEFSRRKKETSP
ncbi:cbb3-type cytochrome oxidase assembly protein CcoS [Oceaniglobus indicus]|uniref:cbb3-type cytochrome oxidase assembly protein CcoS n=1 Tax=Oceaniglobus indicus TaxID=2047749 RepID=UPI000C1A54AA|nr:cbb3-type cytochrome oxidase assembly protein CcoS [Oceaniglobus indicus]